ncbi:MAG: histidine kinase [Lachnospiraceae bacterium]
MNQLKRRVFYETRSRIVMMILIAIVPSILFSLYFSYKYYYYALNNVISGKDAIVQEMIQNLDFQLQYYKNITLTLYYNHMTRNYIDSGNYETKDEYMEAYLEGIVNSESNVVSVVMEIDGNIYQKGYKYYNLDDYLEKHRADVISKGGKVIWIPTEAMSANYHSVLKNFALARAINSKERTIGTIWLFFSSDYLTETLGYKQLQQKGTDYYVLTSDNRIICSNHEELDGGAITDEELIEALEAKQDGSSAQRNKMKNIVVSRLSNLTGWKTVIVVDSASAFQEVVSIRRIILFWIGLDVLVVIVVFLFLTRSIFGPLRRLSYAMREVSDGHFEKIYFNNKSDEIGMLTQNYNFMIEEIERLMKEIREEEKAKNEEKMKALSMQINPHFTFNTLNTVKWMAIANKQTNIKRMIECLIDLMMSVTYTDRDEIMIEKELSLLDSYVYIQKMRFVNFDIVYEVEKETRKLGILKLILQPFVENCIVHAFQGKKQRGIIKIKIYLEENKLHILIEDNGIGFSMKGQKEKMKQDNSDDHNHIGITNVQQRIQLNYGGEYRADVLSELGIGTTIHLILPVLLIDQ